MRAAAMTPAEADDHDDDGRSIAAEHHDSRHR
jgi:hypothetical protein